MQLATATAVAGYSFRARSGSDNPRVDSPHAWRFGGSNDGYHWTELHTVMAEVEWNALEKREYFVPPDAVAPFTYFRLPPRHHQIARRVTTHHSPLSLPLRTAVVPASTPTQNLSSTLAGGTSPPTWLVPAVVTRACTILAIGISSQSPRWRCSSQRDVSVTWASPLDGRGGRG